MKNETQIEKHYEKCAYLSLLCDLASFFLLGGVFLTLAIVFGITASHSKQGPVRALAGLGTGLAIVFMVALIVSLVR